MALTIGQLIQKKREIYQQVVEFMFHNPEVTFHEVGEKFEISHMQASRLWLKAGFAPRKSGRKPRKESTT